MEKKIKSLLKLSEHPFLRKVCGSIFSQGALSATNFLIGILIVRNTPKNEYGLYVICFSIIQIFSSLQNAIINTPMTVMLPAKQPDVRKAFLSGLATGQWMVLLPILGMCAISYSAYALYCDDYSKLEALSMLLVAVPAFFMREFMRTLYYCWLKIKSVIVLDLVFIGCVLSGLLLLVITDKIRASTAVLVLGASYGLSAILGYQMSGTRFRWKKTEIKKALTETWPYSRWALFGVAMTNVESFGYIFVFSSILGLSSIADVSAARLFFMPFGIVLSSSQRIFLAKGSILLSEDKSRFLKMVLYFGLFFLAVWIVYCLLMWLCYGLIIEYLFTKKYSGIDIYVLLWGAVFLGSSICFPITHALQVFKDFKKLSIFGLYSAVTVLFSCIILTLTMGAVGGLLSLLAGNVVMLLCCALRLKKLIVTG